MDYISNFTYSDMKGTIYNHMFFDDLVLAFASSNIFSISRMCQSGNPRWLWIQYLYTSLLMYHIKGWMHCINNFKYSDTKGIVYMHILFADILLAFTLIKFDQIVTCTNQAPQVNYHSETCVLTSWGIYGKCDVLYYQS